MFFKALLAIRVKELEGSEKMEECQTVSGQELGPRNEQRKRRVVDARHRSPFVFVYQLEITNTTTAHHTTLNVCVSV